MSLASLTLYVRYEDNDSKLYQSIEWNERMFKSGCDASHLDPAIILHYRHFEGAAIMALATGVIWGQLFEHQWLANTGRYNSSQWTWQKRGFFMTIIKTLVTMIFLLPFIAGHVVWLPDVVYAMKEDYPLLSRVVVQVALV